MAISAQDVKNLREKTGAGMMDCKKALEETGGDFEKAVDFLKKQGLAKAMKKGSRVAAEGLVFAKITDQKAALVELNCETDFVAKNDDFQKAGEDLVNLIYETTPASLEEALQLKLGDQSVEEKINSLVAVIGEKITLRRFQVVNAKEGGKLGGYIHMGGKIVVVAEVKGDKISDETIRDVGMQIAAMSPKYVDKSEVSQELLNKEKEVFLEQMKDSGKPAEILEKIVGGKLDKFAAEISLNQQIFVKEPSGKKTVEKYLKEIDPAAKVIQFQRFAVGEGIEKKQESFADEVAKMVQ